MTLAPERIGRDVFAQHPIDATRGPLHDRSHAPQRLPGWVLTIALVMGNLVSFKPFRPALLALPIAAVICLILTRFDRQVVRLRVPFALSGFAVWTLLSYGWSHSPTDSAHQIPEYVSMLVTGVLCALVLTPESLISSVARAFRILIVIVGASLVVDYHAATAPPALDPVPGWHGPVGGKNGLGLLMALALIAFVFEAHRERARRWWMVAAAVLLIGSQSGAGWCLSILLVAMLLWRGALRRQAEPTVRVVLKLLATVCSAASVVFIFVDLPTATGLIGKSPNFTGRTSIWSAVLEAIPQHPLAGTGFAGVWFSPTGDTASMTAAIGFRAYEAHQGYLDIVLQLGAVGGCFFLAALAVTMRRLVPGFATRPKAEAGLLVLLLALTLENFAESMWTSFNCVLFAAIVVVAGNSRKLSLRRLRDLGPSPTSRIRFKLNRIGGSGVVGHLADFGWAGLGQVMALLTNGFMFVVLAREFDPSTFGYYAALVGVAGLAGMAVNSWVGMVATENIIRDGERPQRSMDSLASWTSLLAALALLIVSLLAPIVVPGLDLLTVLVFCTATVVGQTLLSLGSSIVQALRGFSRSARYGVGQQAVLLLALLVLWGTGRVTLLAIGLAMAGSYLLAGLVCLRDLARLHAVRPRWGRFSRQDAERGAVYGASMLASAVEEDLDKPMLVSFGYAHAAGLYAVAYNVVTIGLVPLNALTGSTHNEFLRHDPDAIGQHLRRAWRATKLAVGYAVVAAAGLLVTAPVVPLILGHRYAEAVPIIRIMSLLLVLRAANIFPFNALMGLGRRGARTLVLIVSSLLIVMLNLTLIPLFSWRGAAVATLVGEAVYGTLCWVVLIRCQHAHDRAVRTRTMSEVAP